MNPVEFLIPKKGLVVRTPGTFVALPESGAEINMTGKDGRYWRRRINDGSVTIGRKPSIQKPKTKVEDKKEG